jgi:hypothetical protein
MRVTMRIHRALLHVSRWSWFALIGAAFGARDMCAGGSSPPPANYHFDPPPPSAAPSTAPSAAPSTGPFATPPPKQSSISRPARTDAPILAAIVAPVRAIRD